MALSKYNKTVYVNNSAPYLSADNLNNTEDGIEAVTDEVIKQAGEIALKADKTDLPDLTEYVTKTELNNGLATKADASSIPNMALYETKTELETTLKSYAKTTDIPTDFYTKAETDAAIQSAIDGLNKANGVSF